MSSHGSRSGSSRHSSSLFLRVNRPDGEINEFYISSGLTIGRSVANTVQLDGDETISRTHSRIEVSADGTARLCCVDADSTITVGNQTVRELPLVPEVRFSIGLSRFECLVGQQLPSDTKTHRFQGCPLCGSEAESTDGTGIRACSRCHEPLLLIPHIRGNTSLRLVPVKYGDYRANLFVACGGMGIVLKGVHCNGHELVAIKLLKQDDRIGSAAKRFKQEVAMMERVRHPNVVKILNHGQAGSFHFLVMEWIEGTNLKDVIAKSQRHAGLITFNDARVWLEQVLNGLGAIHSQGIVHRDIKPSNVLIGVDNIARIADLGLAKPLDGLDTELTATGHIPGSYAYMAPEQHNTPDNVDQRVDLYAFGVMFYEILTGNRPIGAWQPASTINLTVPPTFDALLGRLLAPRPENRLADVHEVQAALDALTAPATSAGASVEQAEAKRVAVKDMTRPSIVSVKAAPWQNSVGMSFQDLPAGEFTKRIFAFLPAWFNGGPILSHSYYLCLVLGGLLGFYYGSFYYATLGASILALIGAILGAIVGEELGRKLYLYIRLFLWSDEETQDTVTLIAPFSIGVHEVTQSQYLQVMGSNPSHFWGANHPVEMVSWDDAIAFCTKLSAISAEQTAGRVYRLPTEAEWEYACRAGTTTPFSFGAHAFQLGKYAWFADNSGFETHAVGEKLPNAWGLYDMLGNVWEWCSDLDTDDRFDRVRVTAPEERASCRVVRGSDYCGDEGTCRSSYRSSRNPADNWLTQGFRVALSPPVRSPETQTDVCEVQAASETLSVPAALTQASMSPACATLWTNASEILRSAVVLVGRILICLADLTGAPANENPAVQANESQPGTMNRQPVGLFKRVVLWIDERDKNATRNLRQRSRAIVGFTLGAALLTVPVAWYSMEGSPFRRLLAGFGVALAILSIDFVVGGAGWCPQGFSGFYGLNGLLKFKRFWPSITRRACTFLKGFCGGIASTAIYTYTVAGILLVGYGFNEARTSQRGGDRFSQHGVRTPQLQTERTPPRQPFAPAQRIPQVSESRAEREAVTSPDQTLPATSPAEITNSIGMKLKLISAGEFMMGSPADEADRSEHEGPQHKARITKPFYLGVTEVTQGEWFSVMKTKPWEAQTNVKEGDVYPATWVSWDDAVAYCDELSALEGKQYRLPTEAEWEYACRGGKLTAYSFGSDVSGLKNYGWFAANAREIGEKYAHEVGGKQPNPFGLHDMHGNVGEWCSDWRGDYSARVAVDPQGPSTGSFRVVRGGSWSISARLCRSAYRSLDDPSFRSSFLGFRLALSPSGE